MSIFDEPKGEKTGNVLVDLFATNIGRLVISIIIPFVTFAVLWIGFIWLRDTEAPRYILAPVAIIWGVGGVLMLYYSANFLVDQLNTYWKNSLSPFIFVGPAVIILFCFLILPTILSAGISMFDKNDAVMVYNKNLFSSGSGPDLMGKDYKLYVESIPSELRERGTVSKSSITAYMKERYPGNSPRAVAVDTNTNKVTLKQFTTKDEYKRVQDILVGLGFIKSGEAPPRVLDYSNSKITSNYHRAMEKFKKDPERYKEPSRQRRVDKKDFKDSIIKALNKQKLYEEMELIQKVYVKKSRFVLFGNYINAITDSSHTFLKALGNNLVWVLLGPTLCVLFGLIVALLADRSSFETPAKALVFLPMAISFIGAGVIWKFIYASKPALEMQIGLLNAIVEFFGGTPTNWLNTERLNTLLLVVILIWMQTGYAMVLISSAIKGVPDDLLEAARIDGAGEFRIILSVVIPYIRGTILTVWTTITIMSLKIFDIVYSMTGGKMGTDVIATLQYKEAFVYFNNNMGSTYAIIMLILVVPVIVYNLRQFSEREVF